MKFESPSGHKEPNHGLILFILLSVIGIFVTFNIQKLYSGIKKAFGIEYSIVYALDETFYETEKIDIVPKDEKNIISNVESINQKEVVQKVSTPSTDTVKSVKSIPVKPEVSKIEKDSAEIKFNVETNTETKTIEKDTNKIIATPEEKKKKFRLFKKKS